MTKYQTFSQIEKVYSPVFWGHVIANPDKAYTSDTPTMNDCFDAFGEPEAALWINAQITALYGTSSNRDSGVVDGISIFSHSFAAEVRRFKLTELMLFFARYKAGKYDNSYASFDARRIGNAFFKEFLPERNRELDRITRELEQKRIEQRRFTPPEGYTSLSYYQEIKRRAAMGEPEAIKILKNEETV